MVCAGLETLTDNTIIGILRFPTSCYYTFYREVMIAFFLVISMILFFRDKDEGQTNPDFLGSLGVSAIATITISSFMTLLKMIEQEHFIQIVVGGIVIIALWLLKKN